MTALGRPGVIVDAATGIFGDGSDFFVVERQDIEFVFCVAEGDALAIGRPERLLKHGVKAVGLLFGLAGAVLTDRVKLFFTVEVGDEQDFRAVG